MFSIPVMYKDYTALLQYAKVYFRTSTQKCTLYKYIGPKIQTVMQLNLEGVTWIYHPRLSFALTVSK